MGGRLKQLDVLRAFAVLMVVFFHAPWDANFRPLWLKLFGRFGWSGVDLFFVLSGFLVSGLLFREYQRYNQVQLGRFLIRRGLKIYPAFYAFLATSIIISLVIGHQPLGGRLSLKPIFIEAFFVQNYGYYSSLWLHTWSLAVEEHFYLLLGLFVYLKVKMSQPGKNPFHGLIPLFFAVAAWCLIWRTGYVGWVMSHTVYGAQYKVPTWFWTHARIDGLLFGVVLSYLYNFHAEATTAWVSNRRQFILGLSVILLSPSIILRPETPFMQSAGFTCIYLGYGGILMLVMCRPQGSRGVFSSKLLSPLSTIGVYSYSIYLWHCAPLVWTQTFAKKLLGHELGYFQYAGVYLFGSVIGGILMAKIIEIPFLKLRDRLFPSRSAAANVAGNSSVDKIPSQAGT